MSLELEAIAAKKVEDLLALPLPKKEHDFAYEGTFNPWDLFPYFYGNYSIEFDQMAIDVLYNILVGHSKEESLSHKMFRECLCKEYLCDYGRSPQYCYATQSFYPLLRQLIATWREYAVVVWGRDIMADNAIIS